MPHELTLVAFILHIGGGTIGLISGTVAAITPKGGGLHRRAGIVFVVSMLVMAAFACYLGTVIPEQLVNVVIGVFAAYLVATG